MKRMWAFWALIGILIVPGTLYAQIISTDISLEIIPTNPEPGQTVTLTAKSYSADLSQATMVWTYNNTVIARGTGKTTVGVIAPAAGVSGVVAVTATGPGIENAASSIVLRPASVDILWEAADAYTPPFYKGKALLPVNGLARFTAIPSASAPNGLGYSWSHNGSALPDDSGYNKSSVTLTHNEFNRQDMVEVVVSGGVFSGTGMVRVAPLQTPSLIAYQNNEGFIDYTRGYTGTIPFTQPGIVLHFEPYYFSTPRGTVNDLSFEMTIDGQPVTPSRPNEIGLSRPNTAVRSVLNLAITPLEYSLQHVERTFTLLFN